MEDNTQKTIIFCQAVADIIYVLQIIKKKKEENCIIYIMNAENIFLYLKSLQLKVIDIKYIPPLKLNLKSISSIKKTKKEINNIWKNYFKDCINSNVYFFSTSYDYLTGTMIKRLSFNKSNQVYYYNHYDHLTSLQKEEAYSLKRLIQSYIFRYVTGGVRFIHKVRINFPKFDVSKYNIKLLTIDRKPDIEEKLLYNIQPKEPDNILFFLSPDEYEGLTDSSKVIFLNLIEEIRIKGYTVFLKGHPRLGEPIEILEKVDKTIPLYIPSEFLNYKQFKYVIGISSTALCFPAEKMLTQVISLLDILELKDKERQQGFKKYIIAYSDNKILFNIPEIK